jgi:uncharacterized membrane protein
MKKAEMSMSMIIGAVIAIIILVVIVFLVARSSGDTNRSTACPSKGGVCTEQLCSKPIVDENYQPIKCTNVGETCCSITAVG